MASLGLPCIRGSHCSSWGSLSHSKYSSVQNPSTLLSLPRGHRSPGRPSGRPGEDDCPRSVPFPGRSQGQGIGTPAGWLGPRNPDSKSSPATHCDLGPAAFPSGPPCLPSPEKGLSEPIREAGTVASPSGVHKGEDTHSTEWYTGKLPPWEGPVGMRGEGLEAGLSCWGRAGAEQAPSLQQNQGVLRAAVPKASQSNGSTEQWRPKLGDEGRQGGQGTAGALQSGGLGLAPPPSLAA